MVNEETKKLICEGLKKLNFESSDWHVNTFIIYLSELKRWNKKFNLTGIKTDRDIVIKHFLDSLLYVKVIPYGVLKVADIGSGAGFPGIPIKIVCPNLKMYLIEPSLKKSFFLRHIINILNLQNISVIEERVENIKNLFSFDIGITRALFTIKDFISKTSHIIKQGGILIHSKGPKVEKELRHIKNIKYEVVPCELPFTQIKRYIVKIML